MPTPWETRRKGKEGATAGGRGVGGRRRRRRSRRAGEEVEGGGANSDGRCHLINTELCIALSLGASARGRRRRRRHRHRRRRRRCSSLGLRQSPGDAATACREQGVSPDDGRHRLETLDRTRGGTARKRARGKEEQINRSMSSDTL